jgi:membrane protein
LTGRIGVLKHTVNEFLEDDCMSMAAALAYYTVFSLPGLLFIALKIAGAIFGEQAVAGNLDEQIRFLVGANAADQIQTMIQSAYRAEGGLIPSLVGFAVVAFAATGAFVQLQFALNRAWGVMPDPASGGLKNFISKRLLSFGMILAIAFLLVVSLVVSALLAAFGHVLANMLPEAFSATLLRVINTAVSFGVITLLFAAIFRFMPDAQIRWKDVWVGAIFTGILFAAGKFAIGAYLGNSDIGGAFGAAGSLVIVLVWIYYSSMILLLGAEFTQAWVQQHGRRIQPEPGAVHFSRKVEKDPQPVR